MVDTNQRDRKRERERPAERTETSVNNHTGIMYAPQQRPRVSCVSFLAWTQTKEREIFTSPDKTKRQLLPRKR